MCAAISDEAIKNIISSGKRLQSTKGFKVSCPQLHIMDPKVSINFYCNILGMKLLKKLDFPQAKMTDYFLGYVEDDEKVPIEGTPEETVWAMTKSRTIDLRHFWDRTNPYEIGSGFSNLSILVPDVYAVSKTLQEIGVSFIKLPNEGGFNGLALIKDPDGYTVELYSEQAVRDHCL